MKKNGGRDMFNLENVFGKKAKKAMMTKEEIAEFIKTNPEALRSFEESYTKHVKNKVSNNFLQSMRNRQSVKNAFFLILLRRMYTLMPLSRGS